MSTSVVTVKQLLSTGAHFGHLKRFGHPKMFPYVYGIKNQIQIIDLDQSVLLLRNALQYVKKIASREGKILFVGTKRAARNMTAEAATKCGMPYVNCHWLGGMLTNYKTIKKSIKRLEELEQLFASDKIENFTKKEVLTLNRESTKLKNNIGGIRDMGGLPDALFVIDVGYERTAVKEAMRLRIPVIGVVDTNSEPVGVDYLIPGNDDSKRAIALYLNAVADTITAVQEEKAASAKMPKFKEEFVEVKEAKDDKSTGHPIVPDSAS